MTYIILLLYLAFQLCSTLFAQEQLLPVYHFERLYAIGGLSPRQIRAGIVRDSSGYIRIGTGGKLERYDGYSFRQYLNDPADSYSISSNTIKS